MKSECKSAEGAWRHFLVAEGAEPSQPLSSLSPFAIAKGLKNVSSCFSAAKHLTISGPV